MTSHRHKNKNAVSKSWKGFSPEDRKTHKVSRVRLHIGKTLTPRRLLVIAGLVLLTLLPIIFGPKLVPYRLGQQLRHPIRARVDFTWENKEESERLSKRIEATFPRYYREDHNWSAEVFDPVYDLLEKAYELAATNEPMEETVASLEAYAKENQVNASPEECRELIREMMAKGRRLNFYWDIAVPRKKILNSPSFSAGVLSAENYKRERGRTIRILRGDLEALSSQVGIDNAPINIEQMPRLLEINFEQEYGRFSEPFRETVLEIINRRLKPSLLPEDELSQRELETTIKTQIETAGKVGKGTIIMPANQPISSADLVRIRKETEVFEAQSGSLGTSIHLLGMGLLICIATAGYLLYLVRFEKEVLRRERRLLHVFILAVVVFWILKAGMVAGLRVNLTPIGLVAGVAAIIFGARVGVGTTSLLCFSSFILTDADVGEIIALLGSSWIFCCLAPGVRTRSGILRAGFYAGLVSLLATFLWRSASGTLLSFSPAERGWLDFLLWIGFYDTAAWILGGIVLTVALPLLERFLGASTNVTLLELSDQEHPLLRKLVLEA
ncbi:MAG: hypothetical protein JXA52_02290, partial [Planctomycetes bacterium]|nr:hypothetical protein [Planctomycetota bacterium]